MWYHWFMAMTLRLPDEIQSLLRHYADEQGISTHAAVVAAISEWLEHKLDEEIHGIAQQVVADDAELLHRLGTA